MANWAGEAVFYHLYPLGLCGAPRTNDFAARASPRLEKLFGWIPHLQALGVNAVLFGPLFESTSHGYDTADYFRVDRRLGTSELLRSLVDRLHQAGMRVVLDGVFNHVGRDFWAFRDVLARGAGSPYAGWFSGLRFDRQSARGDPFGYDNWNGADDLVKLNLRSPEVRKHLLDAVASWIRELDIDGLRLDVADTLDLDFQRELAAHCRRLKPDFWLMGEVVHGDYRRWLAPGLLDSVTNYEAHKGLWSSHVDRNYFELAYALNRQFGEGGLYQGVGLYNFADNHDVNRAATNLKDPAQLSVLYLLLFAMPGVPSVYYGSEFALQARRTERDDSALRPCLDLEELLARPDRSLLEAIRRLAALRRGSPALQGGDYRQVLVLPQQLAFARRSAAETVVVAANANAKATSVELPLPAMRGGVLVDALNGGERFPVEGARARVELPACWGRIMRLQR